MAALQQLHRFVAGLASVQLGPAELRTVHQAFIASLCSGILTPAESTALLQSAVQYADTAPSNEQLPLLRLQRHLIAKDKIVTDVFGGVHAERLLKQLSSGEVEHRSELGVEITQYLVDLAGVSEKAKTSVLQFCTSAATLPAIGPDDALPHTIPVAYDLLAALLARFGREDAVEGVVQQVLAAVFGASGSLEAALQAASRSLFPAFVTAHKLHPAPLRLFLERTWKMAQRVASLSDESVNVSFSWLCQFYPYYFQNGAILDLRPEEAFWSLLRAGFLSNSSGVRKKAGYLLKRLLDDVKGGGVACAWPSFGWEPAKAAAGEAAWTAFFLLYETTEDFALHLIHDAWQQLELLFDSPAVQAPWLSLLLQRLLRHENPAVKKFALVQLVQLSDPRVQRLEEAFVLSPLLQALSDPSVHKGTAGEHIDGEAVPFLVRYWRLAASRHDPPRFLRLFVDATRQHLSSPRVSIATSFLAAIDSHVPAWDSLSFVALGDIVSRKIGNQPRHSRVRMLEQVVQAVCRFTDTKAMRSPRQAAAVLGVLPAAFLAERPALRAQLRHWQTSLGDGGEKASLLSEVLSGLQHVSAAPALEQLEEAEGMAQQAASLLFVRSEEAEPLARSLLAVFTWPAPSVLQAEKALIAVGALLPAVPVSEANSSALLGDLTRTLTHLEAFAKAHVLPSLSQPPADLPLFYSVHAHRAFLHAFSSLAHASLSASSLLSPLQTLSRTLLCAATAALLSASTGVAAVEFQKLRAMETLHTLLSIPTIVSPSADTLDAILRTAVARPKDNNDVAATWSQCVAAFALQKWEAVLALIKREDMHKHLQYPALLTEARAALDALVPEMVSTLLSVLQLVLPQCLATMSDEAVGELLTQVWNAALELADLSVISSFAAFAFSPAFLPYHNQLRPIFTHVLDFALASGHPIVPYVAVHFLDACAKSQYVMNYEAEFVQLLLYGPLRTDMDAVRYREAEPIELHLHGRTQTVVHQDGFVRAAALAALLRHPQPLLIERLVVKLLEETLALNKRNYRQYTWQHRRAVRMWQVLSLLVPHLHPELEAPINQRLWRIIEMTHMKSVRQYIDLFASNFLLRFPASVHSHFLPLLAQVNGKLEPLGSALGIARELLLHWPQLPALTADHGKLYHSLFLTLMPYSSCNNLVLRTQAQVAIVKLMQVPAFRQRFQASGDLHLLSALNAYLCTNHECAKYLEKYGSLFGIGDVLQIVRMPELLLYGIPVAEKLPAAESISLKILTAVGLATPEGIALLKNVAPEGEAEAEAHTESTGDTIQKKIEPWADIVVDDQLSRETILLRKRQDIIMCASLVDKIPNLGGLARTSEVFAATAIAIPNGRAESDPQFQQVSVNAEKWIPLLEVPPFELASWLQQKRTEGYRILAVEQTSNSVSLEAYEFPTHAVLLLGKEKEGIPVDFLHLVDDCIQIPQLGLTRSLNVHVSGALVLWEYTRQQLLKAAKKAPHK